MTRVAAADLPQVTRTRARGPGSAASPRARAWRVGLALVWLIASGCDSGAFLESPPAACTAIGSRCQLAEGPLGVCQETACAPGSAPPCFKCTPQH